MSSPGPLKGKGWEGARAQHGGQGLWRGAEGSERQSKCGKAGLLGPRTKQCVGRDRQAGTGVFGPQEQVDPQRFTPLTWGFTLSKPVSPGPGSPSPQPPPLVVAGT